MQFNCPSVLRTIGLYRAYGADTARDPSLKDGQHSSRLVAVPERSWIAGPFSVLTRSKLLDETRAFIVRVLLLIRVLPREHGSLRTYIIHHLVYIYSMTMQSLIEYYHYHVTWRGYCV
jgi:hypothetical protein